MLADVGTEKGIVLMQGHQVALDLSSLGIIYIVYILPLVRCTYSSPVGYWGNGDRGRGQNMRFWGYA